MDDGNSYGRTATTGTRLVVFVGWFASLLVAGSMAAACRVEADRPAERARAFYQLLEDERLGRALELTMPGEGRAALERRYGSFEAWVDRVTKSGLLFRTETMRVEREGSRAAIRLSVLFNDGTRRHDELELAEIDGRWLVDLATVRGMP